MLIENLEEGRLVRVPLLDGDEPDSRLMRVESIEKIGSEGEGFPASVMVHGYFEGTDTRTGFRRTRGTDVQVFL